MRELTLRFAVAATLALGSMSGSLSQAGDQPSRETLTKAVDRYLSDHGDLCVGKFTWPRVVTPQDRQDKTNDAVQLPVLERLGLVQATDIAAPAVAPTAADEGGKSYSLTAKGHRYYLRKNRVTVGAHGMPTVHDADLCVAHLSLDKVVKWSPPEPAHGGLESLVRYTYRVKAADWMADPQARAVFPVVDRIIRNEGNLLMSVNVRLENGKWEPVLPTL